jgi:hypothetical protein
MIPLLNKTGNNNIGMTTAERKMLPMALLYPSRQAEWPNSNPFFKRA